MQGSGYGYLMLHEIANNYLRDAINVSEPVIKACFYFTAANFYHMCNQQRNSKDIEDRIEKCLCIAANLINRKECEEVLLPDRRHTARAGVKVSNQTTSIFDYCAWNELEGTLQERLKDLIQHNTDGQDK